VLSMLVVQLCAVVDPPTNIEETCPCTGCIGSIDQGCLAGQDVSGTVAVVNVHCFRITVEGLGGLGLGLGVFDLRAHMSAMSWSSSRISSTICTGHAKPCQLALASL